MRNFTHAKLAKLHLHPRQSSNEYRRQLIGRDGSLLRKASGHSSWSYPVCEDAQGLLLTSLQYAFSRDFRRKGMIALNTYLKVYQ